MHRPMEALPKARQRIFLASRSFPQALVQSIPIPCTILTSITRESFCLLLSLRGFLVCVGYMINFMQ